MGKSIGLHNDGEDCEQRSQDATVNGAQAFARLLSFAEGRDQGRLGASRSSAPLSTTGRRFRSNPSSCGPLRDPAEPGLFF